MNKNMLRWLTIGVAAFGFGLQSALANSIDPNLTASCENYTVGVKANLGSGFNGSAQFELTVMPDGRMVSGAVPLTCMAGPCIGESFMMGDWMPVLEGTQVISGTVELFQNGVSVRDEKIPVGPVTVVCDEPPVPSGITRTPGFWKNHPAAVGQNLPVDFCGASITEVCDAVDLLSTKGGGLNQFTRHAVAAALNCNAFGCPDGIQDLLDEGNAACDTGDGDYDYGSTGTILDEFNNSGDSLPSGLDQSSADPHFCR